MLPATFVDGGREGVLQEAYLDAKFRGEGQRERESHTDIEANTQTQKQSSKQANKQEHRNTSTRVYRHCVSVYTCIYSVSYFCVYTDIHMDMYTHIFVSIDIYIHGCTEGERIRAHVDQHVCAWCRLWSGVCAWRGTRMCIGSGLWGFTRGEGVWGVG